MSGSETPHVVVLTRNQHNIVQLLLRGASSATIAQEKGRATSTVTRTRQHIYEKFQVHSLKELIAALASGRFVVEVLDDDVRPRDLRTGAAAVATALERLRAHNERSRRRRRVISVSLYVPEAAALVEAALTALGSEGRPPDGA